MFILEFAKGDNEQFKGVKINFVGASDRFSPNYYFQFPNSYNKKYKVKHKMCVVNFEKWNIVYVSYF